MERLGHQHDGYVAQLISDAPQYACCLAELSTSPFPPQRVVCLDDHLCGQAV